MTTNVRDYLKWRGDLTFKQDPFNILDAGILSFLIFVNYDKVKGFNSSTVSEVYQKVNKLFENNRREMVSGLLIPPTIIDLYDDAVKTNRFKNLKVFNFVNYVSDEEMCQFCAMTYKISRDEVVIVYRGTDDTTIGWKENIEMLVTTPVKAEAMSAEYLVNIANKFPNCKIYLTGHSKGGHLAEYAAIYAPKEVQDRIVFAVSNDGPGFLKGTVDEEKYLSIKDKIILVSPKDAVVSLLFDQYYGKRVIVETPNKGVMQHDLLSWQVMGNEYVQADMISIKALELKIKVDELIASLSKEEREEVSMDIYNFINDSKLYNLTSVAEDPLKTIKYLNELSKTSKHKFKKLIKYFIQYKAI